MSLKVVMAVFPLNDIFFGTPCICIYIYTDICTYRYLHIEISTLANIYINRYPHIQISTYAGIYTCLHEYLQISTRISTILIIYTHPHRVVVAEDRFSVHGLPHHIVTTAHYWRVSRLSLSSAPVPVPSVPLLSTKLTGNLQVVLCCHYKSVFME